MRTLDAGQTTVLQSQNYRHFLKLEIQDSEGSWVEITDRVAGMTTGYVTIDQAIQEVTFTVIRDYTGGQSLATLHETSTLNLDSGSNYAPLIELNRPIRAYVATLTSGTPSPGDWVPFFQGRVRRTNQAANPLTITCRDDGVRAASAWVREVTEYGTDGGRAIQSVMQDILDDWLPGVTLYTPVDPATVFGAAVLVSKYEQQPMSVLDALQTLALKIGWVVEYRWDASDVFRLTFYEPDRDNTTPAWTFSESDYTEISELELDLEFVRNLIEVKYADATSGSQAKATYRGADSIAQYNDEFWMQIEHGADSPIDSATEAQRQADAAGSDLEYPDAIQEVTVPFFWPVQKGDLLRFTADGIHYTSDQDWAVTGYQHTYKNGHGMTRIRVRGKPAGAYLGWFGRTLSEEDRTPRLLNFRDEDIAGGKRFLWERNAFVAEVWVQNKIVTLPEEIDNWPDRDAIYDDLLTSANSYDVTNPPAGQARLLQFVPRDSALAPGPVKRVRVMPGGLTIQVPVLTVQPTQSGNTYTMTVGVTDPDGIGTAAYFKAAEGTDDDAFTLPPDATWTSVAYGATLTFTATAQPKHTTRIVCAVAYTDEDGNTQYTTANHVFDPKHEANVVVSGSFTDAGRFLANITGDEDTVRGYVTCAVGTNPADPTKSVFNGLVNARTGWVDTGLSVAVGGIVYVKAVGENSEGTLGPVTPVTRFKRGVGGELKTIRVPHGQFSPEDSASTFQHESTAGYMRPGSGIVSFMISGVDIPEGATIIAFRAYQYASGGTTACRLSRVALFAGVPVATTVALLTTTSGGWATPSNTSLSESTTDRTYIVTVSLDGGASTGNSRFAYCEIDYSGEGVL